METDNILFRVKAAALAFIFFPVFVFSQSSVEYETNTMLTVEAGADICSDTKIVSGTYTGGGTFCNGPLPVEIVSFTSSSSGQGRNVTLLWKTDKEINNSGFEIDRKISGSNDWKKISFVTGKGNVNFPSSYTFEDKKLNSGKYNYRLKQIDYNGNFEYHNLSAVVDVALPSKFNLSQNYPNPYNPSTKIDFELPVDSRVTIKVYDVAGHEVAVILNNELRTANYYSVEFNGSNLSSGVYFYAIKTEKFNKSKRMVLIK